MTLSVLDAAAENPRLPALVLDGQTIDYGTLAERTRRRMHWLLEHGASANAAPTPVAVVAQADLETVEILYALFELGVPALLIHPRWTELERERVLEAASVRALPVMPAAAARDALGPVARPAVEAERALAILHTSGSSGAPKGVVLSRRAFIASAQASAQNLGWLPDDRWLLALPPAHVGGLSILTRSLIARRTVVLSQPARSGQGIDPRSLISIVERERVTLLSLVPTLLARLLDLEPAWQPPDALRGILLGGASAPAPLLQRARQRGWPVLTTYGLTETCSQVTAQSPHAHDGAGAGRTLPGIEVRTIDGHIEVRGPVLFSRYFPSGEPAPLREGWFRTGDLGHIDEGGALHVSGRQSEVIITGGENVWPAEVEQALLGCTGVAEACVFALPDDTWGEVVAAALVIDATTDFSMQRLAQELRGRLSSFKRPRFVSLASALPLTPAGKHDRVAIARRAGAELVPLR